MSDSPGDFTIGGMSVRGQTRVLSRFENATKALHDKLLDIITRETALVADNARARMAELFANPARMQASLRTTVEDGRTFIYGEVTASGLPYLAIHEYGGITQPHEIFPRNASVLHFFTPGAASFRTGGHTATNEVFAKSVSHPGSVMPERSYMRYALAQRRFAINEAFARAAGEALDDEG